MAKKAKMALDLSFGSISKDRPDAGKAFFFHGQFGGTGVRGGLN